MIQKVIHRILTLYREIKRRGGGGHVFRVVAYPDFEFFHYAGATGGKSDLKIWTILGIELFTTSGQRSERAFSI